MIFEIQQIDELFTSFSELLEKSKVEEPTLIELTAIGSILHSFYNGIENIFKTIGKNIDGIGTGIVIVANEKPTERAREQRSD